MPNQYTTGAAIPIPVPERFWSNVQFTNSCWLWTASKQRGGYAQFWLEGRLVYTHRWAYEFCVGPIPEGLTIDHLCRVRHCVNPDHLEVVTLRINTLRGVSPSAQNARKTHCPRGHSYDADNTYIAPASSGRHCYTCLRVANRRASLARTLQRGT